MEQLEKEMRKYKCFVILSILGLIFSLVFFVYFLINNDNRFWGFGALLLADIYELQRDIKRYKDTKFKLINCKE